MSYTLIAPTLNPKMAAWLRAVMPYRQPNVDIKYLDELKSFDLAAANWLQNEGINRSNAGDPATYVPAPFTKPIPQREVLDGDEWGKVTSEFRTDMVTPQPLVPTLPPYVAPKPATPIHTGAPADQASDDAAFAAIINLLLEIKELLVAAKK